MSWTEQVSSQTARTTRSYGGTKYSRGIAIRRALVDPSEAPSEAPVTDSNEKIKVYEVKQVKQRLSDTEQPTRYFPVPLLQSVVAIDPGQDLIVTVSESE
jgi:hypothetical protein